VETDAIVDGHIAAIRMLKSQISRELDSAREVSLVLTKLDEAQLWLTRCSARKGIA